MSPIPGTTRDALEVVLELGGHKVLLLYSCSYRIMLELLQGHSHALPSICVTNQRESVRPVIDGSLLVQSPAVLRYLVLPPLSKSSVCGVVKVALVQVILTDTAGVRDAEDAVEAEGVSRAKQAALDADIVVAVADVAVPEHDSRLLQWAQTLVPGPAGRALDQGITEDRCCMH